MGRHLVGGREVCHWVWVLVHWVRSFGDGAGLKQSCCGHRTEGFFDWDEDGKRDKG